MSAIQQQPYMPAFVKVIIYLKVNRSSRTLISLLHLHVHAEYSAPAEDQLEVSILLAYDQT